MNQPKPPPAVLALVEGKNAELKRLHLDARVGDLQGSRVVAVREVLDQWSPHPGTPLHELWRQVQTATEQYTDQIAAIHAEGERSIPGIGEGDSR